MVVGMIQVITGYGTADIPVEINGKGPRPGTVWVTALNGLQPFTKISHGGPYQDNTAVVLIPSIWDIHLEPDPEEIQTELATEDRIKANALLAPDRSIPEGDWFLESAYEDRTCIE
jgi:hypothetical protein